MARYTLKRPVAQSLRGNQMSHPARPGKAGSVRYNSQLAAAIKMTHRAANRVCAASRLVCIPSWNGGLEMSYQNDLSPRKRRCWQRLHLHTVGSKCCATGFYRWCRNITRVRRIFGEWRAKATERTPAPSRHPALYLSCAGLASRATTDADIQTVAAKHARQRFDRQATTLYSPQNLLASNTGCFSRRQNRGRSDGRCLPYSTAHNRPHLLGAAHAAAVLANDKNIRATGSRESKFINWNWASGLFFASSKSKYRNQRHHPPWRPG